VLACTHYPLLIKQFERLAPWPVAWIDPAEAIARRLDHVLHEKLGDTPVPDAANWPQHAALFTSGGTPSPALAKALHERGISRILENPIPTGIA
jgi:glutamate racemase